MTKLDFNLYLTHWLQARAARSPCDEPCVFSTSDVIAFDQNWHHLYSTFAGGKDLSNHTLIRVINLMVPEIFTTMLRNLSEKLGAKFPATTHPWLLHGKNCPSRQCFLWSFWTGSKPSRRLITAAKDKKGKRGKAKEKLKKGRALRRTCRSFSHPKTPKKFDVCVCPSKKQCKNIMSVER